MNRFMFQIVFSVICAIVLACNQIDASQGQGLKEDYIHSWNPLFSPDGKKIAFLSNNEAALDELLKLGTAASTGLYTMNSDGAEIKRIASSDGSGFCWAPDGKSIFFTSKEHDVCQISPDGADLATLICSKADNATYGNLSCSPDGNKILIVKFEHFIEEQKGISPNDIRFRNGMVSAWVLTLTNNEWYCLFKFDDTVKFSYRRPVWSPDGKKIAYMDNRQAFVVDAEGKSKENICQTGANENWKKIYNRSTFTCTESQNIIWSRDGRFIFIGMGGNIFTVDVIKNDYSHLTTSVESIRGVTGFALPLCLSPCGAKMLYAGDENTLQEIDIASRKVTTLVKDIMNLGGAPGHMFFCRKSADYSLDKKSVVYEDNREIYIVNSEDLSKNRLTFFAGESPFAQRAKMAAERAKIAKLAAERAKKAGGRTTRR